MTTQEINLALALITWVLASAVSISHIREHGWRHMRALMGVFIWLAATLLVLTSAGGFFPAEREGIRLVAAFLRGTLLVLVSAYAWDRWLRYRA